MTKIKSGEKVELNLDDLLGIGGESLVIRRRHEGKFKAFKIVPLGDANSKIDEIENIPENDDLSNDIDTKEVTGKSKGLFSSFRKLFRGKKVSKRQNEAKNAEGENVDENEEENNPLLTGQSEFDSLNIQHPNIVNYERVSVDIVNGQPCLVARMEIYDTNLWRYLKSSHNIGRNIPMRVRFKLFEQILAGAREIQDSRFRHLDLKPSNILLRTNPDGSWNERNCGITDFGIGGNFVIGGNVDRLSGTPGFSSPEQLIDQSHQKSDNFSFGKLMVFIFCNWPTSWNLIYQPVTENERNQIPFNPQFLHVVRRLLQVNIVTGVFS